MGMIKGLRRPLSDDGEDAWSDEDAPTPKPAPPKPPDSTATLAAERAAAERAAGERAAGERAAGERAAAEKAAGERATAERAAAERAAAERVGVAAPCVDPQLKKNIEDQLERLIAQLDDIEGLKDELSAEEHASMKQVRATPYMTHAPT